MYTAFPQSTFLNVRDIEQGLENLQNSPSTQPQITVDDSGIKDHANLMIDNVLMVDNPTLLNDFFYL